MNESEKILNAYEKVKETKMAYASAMAELEEIAPDLKAKEDAIRTYLEPVTNIVNIVNSVREKIEQEKIDGEVATALGESIDVLKPVISTIYDKMRDASNVMRESTVKTFKWYLDNGFERHEAMMLILNAKIALQEMMKNSNAKYSKDKK